MADDALASLWAAVLLGGPVLTVALALSGYRARPREARWIACGACVAFVCTATPASLPGHALDYGLLALSWGGLCAAAGALPTRYSVRTSVMILLGLVGLPGLFVALVLSPPDLSRTVDAGCDRRIRFETWGSVSDSGIAAVLLWQPPWTPFEIQLARHEFKGREYPSISGQEALEIVSRGRCKIDVWYMGRMVWRAR